MVLDLSAAYKSKIEDALKLAEQSERQGDYPKAARWYREAAGVYVEFARETTSESIKKQRADLARRFADKARNLDNRKPNDTMSRPTGGEIRRPTASVEDQAEVERSALYRQIDGLIQKVNVGWNDIAGLDEVKTQIRSLYGIKLARVPDKVHLEQNLNLLLYGPPGTGKTLLASAVSNSIEATFFSANASDLVSKWLGESSKLVAALFEQARELSPSVVFIDEFDSLVASRAKSDSQSEARILGSVLSELDGINSRIAVDKLVIVIAATNVPWKLDIATLSRFSGGQVFVPPPDEVSRLRILELNLTENGLVSNWPLAELARLIDGRSGREVAAICKTATRLMIDRKNPDLDAQVDGGLESIRQYELKVGPIEESEFRRAADEIVATVNAERLQRYMDWKENTR